MEIVEKPMPACLDDGLGRLMSFLQVGKCISMAPEEIPGETIRHKVRTIGMRVARIERRALPERHFRCFRLNEKFYVERTI